MKLSTFRLFVPWHVVAMFGLSTAFVVGCSEENDAHDDNGGGSGGGTTASGGSAGSAGSGAGSTGSAGAGSGGSGGSAGSGGDSGTCRAPATPLNLSCSELCETSRACPDGSSNCVPVCETSLMQALEMGCSSEFQSYLECGVTCVNDCMLAPDDCATENESFNECYADFCAMNGTSDLCTM